MAFFPPVFNLSCNLWHGQGAGGGPPVGPPSLTVNCQLWFPKDWDVVPFGPTLRGFVSLRVPSGTDLRGILSSTFQDLAEVPAGTGRFYTVWWVEDVARGFPNEYRTGLLIASIQPTPLP